MLPMGRQPDGWFELRTDAAEAGSAYRFQLADGTKVPDPASRRQAADVHGPSLVVDPTTYRWRYTGWRGRAWEETILYELHLGTFSEEGTFDGARKKLRHLADLGITAIELLPIADFAGSRNWGYDGVLPFAPDNAYGSPDDLKALVDEAHGLGLMVFLDVVYNHFGPDGNYLHAYAPQFFRKDVPTPWGEAIDFRRQPVRDFVIHNALYWLDEYRFDGLRLDAVHAIVDESERHVLNELAERVRAHFAGRRAVHLVLENDANQARFLDRRDHGAAPLRCAVERRLAPCGPRGPHGRDGRLLRRLCRRHDGSARPGADRGLRLSGRPGALARRRGAGRAELASSAHLLRRLSPEPRPDRQQGDGRAPDDPGPAPRARGDDGAPPALSRRSRMLFMGEEWGAETPFLFFCDFEGPLADAVREGRRREFARFPAFADPAARERIPDPAALPPSSGRSCAGATSSRRAMRRACAS